MEKFNKITNSFKRNINALCVFTKKIGGYADQHDESAINEFKSRMENLLEVDFDEPVEDNENLQPTNSANYEGVITIEHTSEIEVSSPDKKMKRKAVIRKLIKDPAQMQQVFEILQTLYKQSPSQGNLLRCAALTTLISYFELLLANLIQEYYSRYPSALPSDERVLSLADLRALGTIEEAQKYLVMKEVDTVLRKSTREQLEYFTKRLKIDLDLIQEYLESLIECVQRRNIITHNDGVVNQYYLAQVSKDFIEANQITEGQSLNVKTTYLSQAIDNIYIVGIILIQQCWRKWDKSISNEADSYLADHIYTALSSAEYEMTIKLARFASKINLTSDYYVRVVTINHAIALKELGKIEEMNYLLEQYDWSSCAVKFLLALSILYDEEDKIYILLPKAVAASEIIRSYMEEWPLFRKLRETQRFQEAIDYYFPKEQENS